MTSYPQTIADYWEAQGYSKAEAKLIERQQIAEAIAAQDADDNYDQMFNCFDL